VITHLGLVAVGNNGDDSVSGVGVGSGDDGENSDGGDNKGSVAAVAGAVVVSTPIKVLMMVEGGDDSGSATSLMVAVVGSGDADLVRRQLQE
jgi:hypothetical protein